MAHAQFAATEASGMLARTYPYGERGRVLGICLGQTLSSAAFGSDARRRHAVRGPKRDQGIQKNRTGNGNDEEAYTDKK